MRPLFDIWDEVQAQLADQMTQATYQQTIASTTLMAIEDQRWLIGCSSQAQYEWVSQRLAEVVQRTIESQVEAEVHLHFLSPKMRFFRRAKTELGLTPAEAAAKLRAGGFTEYNEKQSYEMWRCLDPRIRPPQPRLPEAERNRLRWYAIVNELT